MGKTVTNLLMGELIKEFDLPLDSTYDMVDNFVEYQIGSYDDRTIELQNSKYCRELINAYWNERVRELKERIRFLEGKVIITSRDLAELTQR